MWHEINYLFMWFEINVIIKTYFVILEILLQDMENMIIEVLYVWLEVTFQSKFYFIVLFMFVMVGTKLSAS